MGAGGVRRALVVALRGPARGLRRPGPRSPVAPRDDRGRRRLAGRAGPGPRVRGRGGAGLPQGSGLVGAPEALRQARLRCASRAARRALRTGRSGGTREDAAARDGGAAHGPVRRRAGAHPRAEAPAPAVAGRGRQPARAADGGMGSRPVGGRARDRASGRGRRIDPGAARAGSGSSPRASSPATPRPRRGWRRCASSA